MPVQNVSVTSGSGKDFTPLPKDVYTFQVLDIETKEGTKFQSDEVEEKLVFKFVCLDEGELYGRQIYKYVSQKLVGGGKPSSLYTRLAGLTGHLYSKEECKKASEIINVDFLNSLIGKHVRLSIGQKAREDGSTVNTVESYLPLKKELKAFDSSKVKKDELPPSPFDN